MRRYQQKQILELVKTLSEANTEIKRLLSRKEDTSVIQLLADCQDCAIQIGNYIEQLEGEGTNTVSCLEEYCQLLYQASVEINDTDVGTKIVKRFQRQLIKIENSVKDELKPNKLEIVFLPYKASMWDSLESIWLTAKDDPQCDAFVVAIPYYDRLSGGAFSQMHYEGNQYPDYVPIVDWRSYNLEERHPDVIFTHNPYDEGNYVTSVHPDYYNKKLKSFTDLLCYVPYFVVSDEVSEHFVTCAGPIYADKVFLQSDNIQDTYIRVFKEFERVNKCAGRFGKAENKFIASGSPKFDKVINSKLEDYKIPEEWDRLIKNPDGSRKKTVLYNTSVGTLLSGDDQVLKKLRYVFNILSERDDVVLWWRPHPLNEAAYESMRPQLANEYKAIVAEYRSKGFGIYDDTSDLHRAICSSSAYFGDYSSLVSLYQLTGKPVLIQDLGACFEVANPLILRFQCSDTEVDIIWMLSLYFNGFYRLDARTLDIAFMGSFPNENIHLPALYLSAVRVKNKIYFIPCAAKEMAMLDMTDNVFHKIPLPSPIMDVNANFSFSKFYAAAVLDKYIFMIPRHFPAIVRYDTESGTFEQYTDWLSSFESFSNGRDLFDPTYFCGITIVGKELFSVFRGTNAIVVFDMEMCVSKVYEVGSKEDSYSGICFDGERFWLSPYTGGIIVRWDRQTGEWKEYTTDVCGGKRTFTNAVYAGGYVWVLPYFGNRAFRIDPKSESIDIAEEFEAVYEKSDANYSEIKFSVFTESNGKLYAFSDKTGEIIKYVPETGEMKRRTTMIGRIPGVDYSLHYGYATEGTAYTIHSYLDDIVLRNESDKIRLERNRVYREAIANGDGTAGEKIFEMLKRELLNI